MLDTNVLISLLLFPSLKMNEMMEFIFCHHQVVLSSFVINEFKEVMSKKFPEKKEVIEKLLLKMNFDLENTPKEMKKELFYIRDIKDYPVLYTAIIGNIDVLITGDKDFNDTAVKKPKILTPASFIEKYMNI